MSCSGGDNMIWVSLRSLPGIIVWFDVNENDVTRMIWPCQSLDLGMVLSTTIKRPKREYLLEEQSLKDY